MTRHCDASTCSGYCPYLEPGVGLDGADLAVPVPLDVRLGVALGQAVQHRRLTLQRRRVLRQNFEVRFDCKQADLNVHRHITPTLRSPHKFK